MLWICFVMSFQWNVRKINKTLAFNPCRKTADEEQQTFRYVCFVFVCNAENCARNRWWRAIYANLFSEQQSNPKSTSGFTLRITRKVFWIHDFYMNLKNLIIFTEEFSSLFVLRLITERSTHWANITLQYLLSKTNFSRRKTVSANIYQQ